MYSLFKSAIILFLIFSTGLIAAQTVNISDNIIGDKFSFQSNVLDHSVDLLVGLPKNYHGSNCRYPVHYVLDGQILFTYYYGVMDILSNGEVPEGIIIGIQSMKRGFYFKPGDGAGLFSRFLIEELIPYIDTNYRTLPFRSILGHSTTGAFIVNMFFSYPDYFDLYIAGAPYHSDLFGQEIPESFPEKFNRKKYFYSFYGLKDNQLEKNHWDSLAAAIREKEIENFFMINREYAEEGHYAIVFRYIPDGLKMSFSRCGYAIEPGKEFFLSEFYAFEDVQKSKFNVSFCYSENYYISNSLSIRKKGDLDSAIKLLILGLDYYPESDVIHNVLATQFEESGNDALAIIHYKKALEINPGLEFIRKKLADLE
jgi:uncharacterized protein